MEKVKREIKLNKIGEYDVYFIQTLENNIVVNSSIINGEHLRFIREKERNGKMDMNICKSKFICNNENSY